MICQGAKVGVTTQFMDVSDIYGIIYVKAVAMNTELPSLTSASLQTASCNFLDAPLYLH